MASLHHKLPLGFSSKSLANEDDDFFSRIVSAYQYAVSKFEGHGASMWSHHHRHAGDSHFILMKGEVDKLKELLRNPHTTDLMGFEEIGATKHAVHKAFNEKARQAYARTIYAALLKLAQAIGAIRLRNPEAWNYTNTSNDLTLEELISALDDRMGLKIDFPNPYPNEFGLESSRGIISRRALNAIYQAWRLVKLAPATRASVLEIGAGLGRTAYYCRKFGVRAYTIIDIPLVNVVQADYLGRLFGPREIVLSNEFDDTLEKGGFRVLGPDWLAHSTEKFDITLNADSITEIDFDQAVAYFVAAAERSDVFLSINHEANPFRASDLPASAGVSTHVFRYPYG